jgi:hypothetical protein
MRGVLFVRTANTQHQVFKLKFRIPSEIPAITARIPRILSIKSRTPQVQTRLPKFRRAADTPAPQPDTRPNFLFAKSPDQAPLLFDWRAFQFPRRKEVPAVVAAPPIPIASVLNKPTVSNVFLAEFTAGFWLRGWVVHSANAYKVTFSDFISTPLNAPTEVRWSNIVLTQKFSIADVEATLGSWAFVSGVLYLQPPFHGNIRLNTIVATIPFYFSNKPKIFNDQYYDPRLVSTPNLSLRIEPRFSGVGQVGSGSCQLANGDGAFNEINKELKWDYGRAVFKVGIDSNLGTMAYTDYQTVGTWGMERAETKEEKFTLTLRTLTAPLERSIPAETYNQTTYPQLSRGDVGKVIPIAYGKIFGAKPTLLDPGAKRFKVAGHAIHDILEVRIENDNIWTVTNPATRDLTNGEFTLGTDWSDNQAVSVDFVGKTLANGRPMYNASDIVSDLLSYLGETNLDSASFTAAYNSLDVGLQNDGLRRTILKPSLYLNSATKALDVIGKLNEVASSFLYVNATGQWHFEVFEPKPVGSVDFSFNETDLIEQKLTRDDDASPDPFSKAVIHYARREQDEYAQTIEQTRSVNRYAHSSPAAETPKEIEAPLWEESDAKLYAQRILSTEGIPLTTYRFDVPWQAFFVLPGKQIHLTYSLTGLDAVIEVLEVRHDLINCVISIVAGDRRGWSDAFGWWVSDSQPAWSAGASDATKLSNRQSSGYWHGDDNLAVSTDGKSAFVSQWW